VSPTPAQPYAPRWLLLVAVSVAAFITGLDNTVLNIALPSLQADLHLSLSGLQWVGTSYILAFSSLLMVGGRLTDLLGRKIVLEAGMAIFTAASVFAGLAPNGTLLIIARVLQGVGGALVLPSTLTVLGTDLEEKDRHLGVGVWTASIAAAIALGPIVGGSIIEVAHWSWIFFINLPIGIAAIILVRKTVAPEAVKLPPRPELIARLDLPGLLTSSIALMCFTFVLVHGQEHGFGAPVVVGALILGVVSAVLFVRTEKSTEYPLVDLTLFESRIFAGGTAAQIIWGLGINGILFFTSLFLQDVLKLDPFEAGLCYVPLAVTIGIGVPIGAKLATNYGANVTVAIGMVLIAFGLFLGVFVDANDSPLQFLLGLMVVGFGSGLTTPMTSAVMEVIPPEKGGGGAAVISTAREISGVIGIAFIGAVLVVARKGALDDGLDPIPAFVYGYHLSLYVVTGVMLIGAVVSYLTLTTRQEAIDMSAEKAAEAAAAAERDGAASTDADADDTVLESLTQADGAVATAEAIHAVSEIAHDRAAQHAHGNGNGSLNGHAASGRGVGSAPDAGDDAR
jgi:EmrB/QacA subfamily drug resistance transporter